MQSGDGSYRRAENCETAVSKGHLNVGSYLLRCCDILWAMLFLHLCKFSKLCSSMLWLFLKSDCLKYYNGKVGKVFYEKISDTTMLTVFWQIIRIKTRLTIAYFFSQQKAMVVCTTTQDNYLCGSVRQGSYFPFLHDSEKQGKINIKYRHFELNRLGEEERCRVVEKNSILGWHGRAKDFSLIKNHAIPENITLYKHLACSLCRFCQFFQTVLKLLFQLFEIQNQPMGRLHHPKSNQVFPQELIHHHIIWRYQCLNTLKLNYILAKQKSSFSEDTFF